MDPADFVGGASIGIGSAANSLLGLSLPTTTTTATAANSQGLSSASRQLTAATTTTTTTTSSLVGSHSAQAAAAAAAASLVAPTGPNSQSSGSQSSASLVGGHENGPILYSEPNRTSAIDDIRSVVIYIFIITVFFGFFLILPGIRNEKFPTFLCITTSLIVTSIILVSLFGTTWHIAEAPISAAYRAFSRDRIQADISVNIGLQSFNVTLRASKILNIDINYNERFYWIKPDQMQYEQHNALERGLPYPILTVVEYLSQDEAGFSWSRQYRLAGYYSHIILWLSICLSVLMFFLHCTAPKYGIYTMQLIGCMMLFTNFTYATLVPKGERKLVIPFEGHSLLFRFGRNFWLIFIGGCLSLTVGTIIVIIDCLFPNFIFTTILDVDFDSHTKCSYKKKQQLEQQKQQEAKQNQYRGLQTKQQAPMKSFQAITSSDSETIVRRNSSRKNRQNESSVIEMPQTVSLSLDEDEKLTVANYVEDRRRRISTGNSAETNHHREPQTDGPALGGLSGSGRHQLAAGLSSKNGNLKSTDQHTRRQANSKGEMIAARRTDTHHDQRNNQQVRL